MGASVSVGELEEFDSVTWQVGLNEFEGTAVSDLPSGLCEVSVVSLEGCEVSEYVWVDAVGVPEVNLGPDVFACAGDLVTLLGPLGNGLNYNWSTGASTPLLQFAAEPGTTVLGLEVTDATGCSDSDVMVLTVDDCTSGLSDLSSGALATTTWEGALAVPNPFIGRTSLVGVSSRGRGLVAALGRPRTSRGRHVDATRNRGGVVVGIAGGHVHVDQPCATRRPQACGPVSRIWRCDCTPRARRLKSCPSG